MSAECPVKKLMSMPPWVLFIGLSNTWSCKLVHQTKCIVPRVVIIRSTYWYIEGQFRRVGVMVISWVQSTRRRKLMSRLPWAHYIPSYVEIFKTWNSLEHPYFIIKLSAGLIPLNSAQNTCIDYMDCQGGPHDLPKMIQTAVPERQIIHPKRNDRSYSAIWRCCAVL